MSLHRRLIATGFAAHAVLAAGAVLVVAPLAWLAVSALKTNEDFFSWIFLPLRDDGVPAWGRLTLRHFGRLFGELGFGRAMLNSVFLSSTTKIVDRATGETFVGRVPAFSVVVPGALPGKPLPDGSPGPSLACAVIVKRVDAQTRAKTAITELLRD
jgi:hypothetical protein